jgi:serine/threonine-protein kinase
MQPGMTIGAYQIVGRIGEGGMGVVYEAVHALIGRRAAIKVLLPEYSQNQAIVSRFFNEARAATAVADPGIVQIFDFGYHSDGSAYIVMEFLSGESLGMRLHRVGRLPVENAARLSRQVAMALATAHRGGIVHRDLKPENVFLVADTEVIGGERAKVLDFGVAKLAGTEPGLNVTRTGAVVGTPAFMSPEQCRGSGSVVIDHRADIYALGCILFTLITGRPPFVADGSGDLIIAHVTQQPPPPSQLAAGISPELDAIVLRCLAKSPDARFQSMVELAQALSALLDTPRAPVVARTEPSRPMPVYSAATITGSGGEVVATQSSTSKRVWIVAASATVAVAIGAIVFVVASKRSGGDAPAPAPASETHVSAPAPPPPAPPVVQPPPSEPPQAHVAPTGSGSAAGSSSPPMETAKTVAPEPAKPAKPKTDHPHATTTHSKAAPCPPDDLYCVK